MLCIFLLFKRVNTFVNREISPNSYELITKFLQSRVTLLRCHWFSTHAAGGSGHCYKLYYCTGGRSKRPKTASVLNQWPLTRFFCDSEDSFSSVFDHSQHQSPAPRKGSWVGFLLAPSSGHLQVCRPHNYDPWGDQNLCLAEKTAIHIHF